MGNPAIVELQPKLSDARRRIETVSKYFLVSLSLYAVVFYFSSNVMIDYIGFGTCFVTSGSCHM